METVYTDDSYLLSDRELAASDTWATAITLSAGLETYQENVADVDIVFAGFKTADGETGQTGPQTCWAMDWPIVTHVVALDIDPEERTLRAKRLVEGDVDEIETVEAPLTLFRRHRSRVRADVSKGFTQADAQSTASPKPKSEPPSTRST